MDQKKNLTIDDIARELGVSKTTVSRAISGKGRIGAATRLRVQEYIEKNNYRPSAAAKGLAESRTYNIALVLPKSFIGLDQPHIRQSMSAICEEAFQQDYNVLVCLSTDDTPAALLRTLDNRKVDGVILSRTVEHDVMVEILSQRNIPFATIGSLHTDAHGLAIVEADHDQVGGCREFSLEFLKRGTGKVALLGNDIQYIVNQSRQLGFCQAAKELGIPEKDIAMRFNLCDHRTCVRTVEELLQQGFTRFLAMDDEVCIRVLGYLNALGKRIPENVQIASLYDVPQLCSTNPPVSALEFNAYELGQAACRELLNYLKQKEYNPKPLLGYRIHMRQST